MAEVSVLDQIKKLVEIQKLDEQIYNLKKDLKDKPAALSVLKDEFEAKKANLNALEAKSKEVQVERNTLEKDLQEKEAAIAKANSDLSQIKTNKEYTAKIGEIESIKADSSIIEENILKSYEQADAIQAEVEKEQGLLAEEEKKYLEEKQSVEGSIKEIDDRVKVLEAQREQLLPGIDKATLARYERILENKGGLAIVPLQGNSCGGCFMNVPPQMINEIQSHEKIMFCEMCARMLYLEDDL